MSDINIGIGEVNFKKVFKTQTLDEHGNVRVELSMKPTKGHIFVSMLVSLVDGEGRLKFNDEVLDGIIKNIGFSRTESKKKFVCFSREFEKQMIAETGQILQRYTFKTDKPKETFVSILLGEVNQKEIGSVDLEKLLESLGYKKD